VNATQEKSGLLKCELTHAGKVLTLAVLHGKRLVETVYLVQAAPGRVDLVTDEGEVYTVTRYGCTCADWRFRGKKMLRFCKHRLGLAEVNLLPPVTTEPEREEP
jgi:hypothetical protein